MSEVRDGPTQSGFSTDIYHGQKLDNSLEPYGISRIVRESDGSRESDESLRERAFRELVLTTKGESDVARRITALEFIFGERQETWDRKMRDLGLGFIRKTQDKYIDPFTLDQPPERRNDMIRSSRSYSSLDNAMNYFIQRWEMSSSYRP